MENSSPVLRTLLGALAPRLRIRYFAGPGYYANGKCMIQPTNRSKTFQNVLVVQPTNRSKTFQYVSVCPRIVIRWGELSSGFRRCARLGRAPHLRGPLSRCCQSSGMPFASSCDPPPHLSPFMKSIRPQICLCVTTGPKPIEISTPVAGHVRWVDTLSGAVGRPRLARLLCSLAVRYPLTISTGRLVSSKNCPAEMTSRDIVSSETDQRRANSHASPPERSSRSGMFTSRGWVDRGN